MANSITIYKDLETDITLPTHEEMAAENNWALNSGHWRLGDTYYQEGASYNTGTENVTFIGERHTETQEYRKNPNDYCIYESCVYCSANTGKFLHDWTPWEWSSSTQHKHTCQRELCKVSEEQDHFNTEGKNTYIDEIFHGKICDACEQFYAAAEHYTTDNVYRYNDSIDRDRHYQVCDGCFEEINWEDHYCNKWIYVTEDYHGGPCGGCSKSITSSHYSIQPVYRFSSTDKTYHYYTCDGCGGSAREEHAFSVDDSFVTCTLCGMSFEA